MPEEIIDQIKVYFCGMIGSGKTTLGKALAEKLHLDFYDLDQEMDRMLGYSFHRLVQEKGWLAFRELEYAICKKFAVLPDGIICLGGGTIRYEWNRDVLRNTGKIILLEASVETLIKRVKQADRPRVNAGTNLEEDIRRIWKESEKKYRDAADIIYRSDEKSIEKEIEELAEIIRNRGRDR